MAENNSTQDKAKEGNNSPQQPKGKTAEQVAAENQAAAEKAAKEAQAAAEKEAAAKKAAFEKSEKVEVEKKNKGNYVPAPGTEGNYHALIEVRNFDQQSGKRTSSPRVQVFAPKAWLGFEKNAAGLGYHVDILHDPTGEYPVVGMAAVKAKK